MEEDSSSLTSKIVLLLIIIILAYLLLPDLVTTIPAAPQTPQMSEPTQASNSTSVVDTSYDSDTGVTFVYEKIPHVNLTPITINRAGYISNLTQPTRCEIHPNWPSSIQQHCGWITLYSEMHGIDPDVTAAVMMQESNGNLDSLSFACAVGLMQVMPSDGTLIKIKEYPYIDCDPNLGSVETYKAQYGTMFDSRPSTEELWAPDFNIFSGTYILSQGNGDYNKKVRAYFGITDGDGDEYYLSKVLGHYQRITGQDAFPSS